MTDRTPPLTPRMQRTLERAGDFARARHHDYLGTEHMLLAILEDPEGIAGGVIHRLGFAMAIHDEVVRLIESDGYARTT
jgi:ATP-dependent Clp protease ATP-binding subunit ClpA